jgi:type II secretory pathway pseudopilin PulG
MKNIFSSEIIKVSGFTILEVTVVVFIMAIGLVGILSLGNQNIQVQYINKNNVIASQLAQEGLELVRNKRDTNWLRKEDWEHSSSTGSRLDILPGKISGSGSSAIYTIDAVTGEIYSSITGINDTKALLYLNNYKLYTHQSTSTSTPFSRIITVGNESTASTSITCLVQWKRGTNTYNFSAQTVLYNWR